MAGVIIITQYAEVNDDDDNDVCFLRLLLIKVRSVFATRI